MLLFINRINKKYKIIIKIIFDFLFSFIALLASTLFFIKDFTFLDILFNLSLNHYFFIIILLFSFLPIFLILKIYKFIIRYFNFYNYIILIIAFFIILFINYISYLYLQIDILERYFALTRFIVFHSLIFLFLSLSFRYFTVLIYKKNRSSEKVKNILIYGAGNAGSSLISQLYEYNIVGFIDDDKNKIGNFIIKYKIFSYNQINKLIKKYSISLIIVSIPSLNNYERYTILNKLKDLNISVRILPKIEDIINENFKINDFKFLPSDLVHRQITYDENSINNFIKEKCILITGAGGSIGSELTRQIIKHNPKKIILVDNNEFHLFNIINEIESVITKNNLKTKITKCLFSITNKKILESIINKYQPNLIYHAAAYKHVFLLEENIYSAFYNNIIGSMYLIELSIKYKVKNFIFISTDKAVKPSSVMGFTKSVIEKIIFKYIAEKNNETIFSIVRFGNVLNSHGSVIPLFQKQIESGGPLTITHPEVKRYFMTIPEASILVLQSSILNTGKGIYVLNMGDPIKIIDLAKILIKFYGKAIKDEKNLKGDIEIKYIGLRKGEKLNEDLYYNYENLIKTSNKDIFLEKFDENSSEIENIIHAINEIINKNESNLIDKFYNKYFNNK